MKRLAAIGVSPGAYCSIRRSSTRRSRRAIERGVRAARGKIETEARKPLGKLVNNWSIVIDRMGSYGTDYLFRSVDRAGRPGGKPARRCALSRRRAWTPTAQTLTGANRYVIHFAKGQLPPVGAFWSLTMYNSKHAFVDNPINRYAIGDRDKLTFDDDGSLTLYVQYESPGRDKESNWLPASKDEFNLVYAAVLAEEGNP